jgi:eukaryotic-like serine/threonine-protein kinase
VLEAGDTAPGLSQSPTITSPAIMTGVGVLLGTAAYMSPEQAKGRPADKRSDVWAFGCVLYEMLAGKRAFEGEDVTETLAAVVMRDPDWSVLPATTPAPVKRLLRRALQRDRRQRLADIADARLDLQEADALSDAPPVQAPTRRYRVALSGAGLMVILSMVALWALWRTPGPAPDAADSVLFEIATPVGTTFGYGPLSLSPDGRHVAFVARSSDGRFLLFAMNDPKTSWDLWVLPLAGGSHAETSRADAVD